MADDTGAISLDQLKAMAAQPPQPPETTPIGAPSPAQVNAVAQPPAGGISLQDLQALAQKNNVGSQADANDLTDSFTNPTGGLNDAGKDIAGNMYGMGEAKDIARRGFDYVKAPVGAVLDKLMIPLRAEVAGVTYGLDKTIAPGIQAAINPQGKIAPDISYNDVVDFMADKILTNDELMKYMVAKGASPSIAAAAATAYSGAKAGLGLAANVIGDPFILTRFGQLTDEAKALQKSGIMPALSPVTLKPVGPAAERWAAELVNPLNNAHIAGIKASTVAKVTAPIGNVISKIPGVSKVADATTDFIRAVNPQTIDPQLNLHVAANRAMERGMGQYVNDMLAKPYAAKQFSDQEVTAISRLIEKTPNILPKIPDSVIEALGAKAGFEESVVKDVMSTNFDKINKGLDLVDGRKEDLIEHAMIIKGLNTKMNEMRQAAGLVNESNADGQWIENYLVHMRNPKYYGTSIDKAYAEELDGFAKQIKATAGGHKLSDFDARQIHREAQGTLEEVNAKMFKKYGVDDFYIKDPMYSTIAKYMETQKLISDKKVLDYLANSPYAMTEGNPLARAMGYEPLKHPSLQKIQAVEDTRFTRQMHVPNPDPATLMNTEGKTVYHGTKHEFQDYNFSKSGGLMHFAEEEGPAREYASGAGGNRGRTKLQDSWIVDHNTGVAYEVRNIKKDGNGIIDGELHAIGRSHNGGTLAGDLKPLTGAEAEEFKPLDLSEWKENAVDDNGTLVDGWDQVPKSARIIEKDLTGKKILDVTNSNPNKKAALQVIAKLNKADAGARGENLIRIAESELKNPLGQTFNGHFWSDTKYAKGKDLEGFHRQLRDLGYDGIRFNDDSHKTVALFRPRPPLYGKQAIFQNMVYPKDIARKMTYFMTPRTTGNYLGYLDLYNKTFRWSSLLSPGFYLRNWADNIFKNYIQDVKMADYMTVARMYKGEDAMIPIHSAQGTKFISLGQLREETRTYGIRTGGQFNEGLTNVLGVGKNIAKAGGAAKIQNGVDKTADWVMNGLRHIGEKGDNWTREALYINRRLNGYAPDSAAMEVEKYLFDFGRNTKAVDIIKQFPAPFIQHAIKTALIAPEMLGKAPAFYNTLHNKFMMAVSHACNDPLTQAEIMQIAPEYRKYQDNVAGPGLNGNTWVGRILGSQTLDDGKMGSYVLFRQSMGMDILNTFDMFSTHALKSGGPFGPFMHGVLALFGHDLRTNKPIDLTPDTPDWSHRFSVAANSMFDDMLSFPNLSKAIKQQLGFGDPKFFTPTTALLLKGSFTQFGSVIDLDQEFLLRQYALKKGLKELRSKYASELMAERNNKTLDVSLAYSPKVFKQLYGVVRPSYSSVQIFNKLMDAKEEVGKNKMAKMGLTGQVTVPELAGMIKNLEQTIEHSRESYEVYKQRYLQMLNDQRNNPQAREELIQELTKGIRSK